MSAHSDLTKSAEIKAAQDQPVAAFGCRDAAFKNAGIERRGASIVDLTEKMLNWMPSIADSRLAELLTCNWKVAEPAKAP
ncbi:MULTISPECIES: hypothetical protein [unclassified Mesorhizobium]|uniref:hypothetical protein n=1 Tax=unclassified Mesorhizobium TaxID=325217 RepID=UPI000FD8D280|nr:MULTISPECIES: hypothetical protein [unclassified Mesorhizobium]TGR23035.1 hypothetical protein EN840_21420 [Mesorhizobium sp. M8A.F.Ca.ET.197.01.1.1]TGR39122.1 hypothetical protein EN842_41465 [bacterium M00.F.Ca.ET.199.01.1.1]TGR46715.1 hypothetical protein EN841_21415 [Mesorhizobium sp. M8A.F.Ca.ET.198.01.1.1]TGV85211.1 hypothetical protein EN792_019055 [Mesorhizobium sp. M00.F.Ca.ET.149.01.1.1]